MLLRDVLGCEAQEPFQIHTPDRNGNRLQGAFTKFHECFLGAFMQPNEPPRAGEPGTSTPRYGFYVRAEDLDKACIAGKWMKVAKVPIPVKPVEINDRLWLCTSICYGAGESAQWRLLPLYASEDYPAELAQNWPPCV